MRSIALKQEFQSREKRDGRDLLSGRLLSEALLSMGFLNKGFNSPRRVSAALRAFQFEQCLPPTGRIDSATVASLTKCQAQENLSSPRVTPRLMAASGPLTDVQLARIMPDSTLKLRQRYLPALNAAMAEFQIHSPLRRAAFLSQVAVETSQLRFMSEMGSVDELNEKFKGFHGRGLMQLTWKTNYESAGRALSMDLKKNPNWVAEKPEVAARTAAWFFHSRKLNAMADQGRIGAISLKINGGYRALDDRLSFYERALSALETADTFASARSAPIAIK